ncbi:MAG: PD-(D/E)XK nuclease family protein [Pseudomonadales bacterium]|jgi:ATP-dependent helicase/nuclease subunit B|tara:strand:+ start:8831 stop:11464 length:2634 start_codon:yes stop_codon:yes gene_type:complete
MPSTFVHISPLLLNALEHHLVVTPNERLAREYRSAYDLAQAANGARAWPTLNCISLRQLLVREFTQQQDLHDSGKKIIAPANLLLRFQTAAPEGAEHLTPIALQAWELVRRYAIDLEHVAMNSGRSQLFTDWARRVNRQINKNEVVEADIAGLLVAQDASINEPILLIAFEHLTKAETGVLEQLNAKSGVHCLNSEDQIVAFAPAALGELVTLPAAQAAPLLGFNSFAEELAAAACWSKHIQDTHPESCVGVVIPSLVQDYAMVQRQFAVTLNPDSGSAIPKFDMSGGTSLSTQPVWLHARTLLNWCEQSADPNTIAKLADSPFLHLPWCNTLNKNWPNFLRRNIAPQDLKRLDSAREASNLINLLEQLPQRANIREWVSHIRDLLKTADWPKLSNINSIQYQAAHSIFTQFDSLASLQNQNQISLRQALDFIEFNLEQKPFAPQRQASPIQILGLLETTGLSFSHLWVCGMSASNFPSSAQLNPFIPRSVAEEFGLPRCNQEQELAFAQRTLGHWQNCAAQLHFSYTQIENDAPQLPSKLVLDALTDELHDSQSAGEDSEIVEPRPVDYSLRHPLMVRQGTHLEYDEDGVGTALTDSHIKGGTGILKNQANCPFKAYATSRLGLKQPRQAKDFLDAIDRGNSLHKVLENLMRIYADSESVKQINGAEIEKQCRLVLATHRSLPTSYIDNEVRRITDLVHQWLALEVQRRPFKVTGIEQHFDLDLAGLTFSLQIDRVDEIDQQEVIIDYKSNKNTVKGALAEPISDPQLAAYALLSGKVAGVYFASIKDQEVSVDGIADPSGNLLAANSKGFSIKNPDGTNLNSKDSNVSWNDKVASWQLELTELAQDIALGKADVAPSKGACEHCHLTNLCRINGQ